ncbi:MAG: hypothetical protein V1493_06620 [Candidatus Diapherotrites archaeon]
MRVLIAFQAESRSNAKVAGTLRQEFEKIGWQAEMHPVLAKKTMKWFHHVKEFRKKKKIELKEGQMDAKKFDLVVVGTPVWTYKPTPLMTTFLREMENTKGKNFALFVTCVGFPGTTIKTMSGILNTGSAKVVDSLVLRSIFELDEKKLALAKEFAKNLSVAALSPAKED